MIHAKTQNHAKTQETNSAALAGALNWIEPPTADIGGATAFFARALETCLGDRGVDAEAARNGAEGYLAVPDLAAAIAGRTAAGWRALTDIIDLPAGIGRIAHMCDAAGGRVGLHEPGVLTSVAEGRHSADRVAQRDADKAPLSTWGVTHRDAKRGYVIDPLVAGAAWAGVNAAC